MILMFVQLFKDATAFFSRATPYLAKVIPAMNHIDQHLATAARNNAYKPCIQAAIAMGKKLLNKYYSYTDHSELYWIAMRGFPSLVEYWFNVIFVVLHPSHKLAYFTKLDGMMNGTRLLKTLCGQNLSRRTQILKSRIRKIPKV